VCTIRTVLRFCLIVVHMSLLQASSESSETECSESCTGHSEEHPGLQRACLKTSGMNFIPYSHTSTMSCPSMSEAVAEEEDYEGTDFLFLVTDYREHEKGQQN
jgi:hypothetical protein